MNRQFAAALTSGICRQLLREGATCVITNTAICSCAESKFSTRLRSSRPEFPQRWTQKGQHHLQLQTRTRRGTCNAGRTLGPERPAQSPTLSPTKSATTAGLRGSSWQIVALSYVLNLAPKSSGMSDSTLPTMSAPTSAACRHHKSTIFAAPPCTLVAGKKKCPNCRVDVQQKHFCTLLRSTMSRSFLGCLHWSGSRPAVPHIFCIPLMQPFA